MSPKRKNTKLPHRVVQKHGAYYYLRPAIKNGKNTTQWLRLGKTEQQMLNALAALKNEGAGKLSAVIKRYRDTILARKAANTQKTQSKLLDRIGRTFGHMNPADIRPAHIAKYHDLIGATAPYQANRELALITHVLKYAVRWGYIDDNPSREIQRHAEHPRKRYITHPEYIAVRDRAPQWVAIIMDLGYITGQRRVDLLNLQRQHITRDGLVITQSKTGTALLIEWTPDLKSAINRALEKLHSRVESMYVICDSSGQRRKDAAFTSAWTRLMDRCIDDGVLTEKFQFRDIRGKAGSDSSGEHLGHRSTATLNLHYKRLPKVVKPTQ